MAYIEIPESLTGIGKPFKKELADKIRNNFIDHEARLQGLTLGSAPIVVFNDVVVNASSASTFTGLAHFRASSAFSVSLVQIGIFTKGSIVSGTVSVDIKKAATLAGPWVSILTSQPTINFATAVDYDTATGILDGSNQTVAQGDYLRLDVTALPSVTLGKFTLLVYGNI